MAFITSIWHFTNLGVVSCLHHPPSHQGSWFVIFRYFLPFSPLSAGSTGGHRCVVHVGGVGVSVEGVGEGQEAGQAPRNLSFFTLLTPSPLPPIPAPFFLNDADSWAFYGQPRA